MLIWALTPVLSKKSGYNHYEILIGFITVNQKSHYVKQTNKKTGTISTTLKLIPITHYKKINMVLIIL